MKIRKIDRKIEKDILIGLITDKTFLSRIRRVIELKFFKNSYAKTIAKWVLDFYDKYEECPFNEIQKIYDYHERKGEIEENDLDPIKSLLEVAANEYSEGYSVNVEFLLDKAEEYFNRVNMELLFAEANELMQLGEVKEATDLIFSKNPIRISQASGSDGLTDKAKLEEAFNQVTEPLFRMSGAFGDFINPTLCRDSFIVFQAGEKVGKTWMLLYTCYRALSQGKKVVFFSLGDMTEPQINLRMSIMISKKSNLKRYCNNWRVPTAFIDKDSRNDITAGTKTKDISYEILENVEPLNFEEALTNNQKFYDRHRIKKDKNWRLICVPGGTMNVKTIDSELERLANEEDFVADVVVLDYMDILAAEQRTEDKREKINANWLAVKSCCNKWHNLWVSATQANASTYDGRLQSKGSFSEDHRKYAHPTAVIGLSQTQQEKKAGLIKANYLAMREGDSNELTVCWLLQSLSQGRPVVDSVQEDFTAQDAMTTYREEDANPPRRKETQQQAFKPQQNKEDNKEENKDYKRSVLDEINGVSESEEAPKTKKPLRTRSTRTRER